MRIITGRAKGLRLKTPAGLATRPTSDRQRERCIQWSRRTFQQFGR
ncbi:MAG: RsmD family RNA methyltransferase, partial [Selenomonadaceae bacterium]|nr:RsmD family RNA methyltransferase [Selenomonadaceae bacterium]